MGQLNTEMELIYHNQLLARSLFAAVYAQGCARAKT